MKTFPKTMKLSIVKTISAAMMIAALAVSCEKDGRIHSKSDRVGFVIYSNETKGAVTTTASINTIGNQFLVDLYDHGTNDVITFGRSVTCVNPEEGSDNVNNGKEWSIDGEIIYWLGADGWRTIDAWARYPLPENMKGSMGLVATISGDKLTEFETDEYGHPVAIDNAQTSLTFNYLTYHGEDGDDAEKQDDLLFAHSYARTHTQNDGRIPIHFYHALSAIYFKTGKETADDSGYEIGENVRIDAIEILGVKRAGTCNYKPVQLTGDNVTLSTAEFDGLFTWATNTDSDIDRSVGNYRQNFSQVHTPGAVLGGETFGGDKTFLLIPQTMTEDAKLTVYWSTKVNGEWVSRDPRTASIYKIKDTKGNESVVTWKAGYKYLYTIKIKHIGAELDLTLDVEDWDYQDMTIKYGDNPACSAGGQLKIGEDNSTYNTTTDGVTSAAIGNKPATCTFTLDAPVGGQWIVALTDSQHFALSLDPSGTPASSTVTGEIGKNKTATFYVVPTTTDRSKDWTTSIKISAILADGTTKGADEPLETSKWRVVLPATM